MTERAPTLNNISTEIVSENTDKKVYTEIKEFLKENTGLMGPFEHLRKYFSDEIQGENRIKESIFWKEVGERNLVLVKDGDKIIGLIALGSSNEHKVVEISAYLTPEYQGKNISMEKCKPTIMDLYNKKYKEKGFDLVVSTLTPQAKRMIEKANIKLVPSGLPDYLKIDTSTI